MPTNRLIELGHRVTQDVRYAIRGLRRTPAFAAAAILSLALGIGANTAIFSALDSLMFRPLAVAQPERLVTFEQVFADGSRQYNLSFQDYRALAQLPFLEGTAA